MAARLATNTTNEQTIQNLYVFSLKYLMRSNTYESDLLEGKMKFYKHLHYQKIFCITCFAYV